MCFFVFCLYTSTCSESWFCRKDLFFAQNLTGVLGTGAALDTGYSEDTRRVFVCAPPGHPADFRGLDGPDCALHPSRLLYRWPPPLPRFPPGKGERTRKASGSGPPVASCDSGAGTGSAPPPPRNASHKHLAARRTLECQMPISCGAFRERVWGGQGRGKGAPESPHFGLQQQEGKPRPVVTKCRKDRGFSALRQAR